MKTRNEAAGLVHRIKVERGAHRKHDSAEPRINESLSHPVHIGTIKRGETGVEPVGGDRHAPNADGGRKQMIESALESSRRIDGHMPHATGKDVRIHIDVADLVGCMDAGIGPAGDDETGTCLTVVDPQHARQSILDDALDRGDAGLTRP